MRCETARMRYPDEGARAHATGCVECTRWIAALERARSVAGAGLPPVTPAAAAGALSALREPLPPRARPPRRMVRTLVAAALLTVVAAIAFGWSFVVRPSPAEALEQAAATTKASESARFTFDGAFSLRLRIPPGLLAGIEAGIEKGVREELQELDPIRKGPPDVVSVWRELLGDRAGVALATLEGFVPELRLGVSGGGAFAPGNRVRLTAEARLEEPVQAGAGLRAVRVGQDLYLRAGEAPWLIGEDLPAILGPVGEGLGRLSDWIHDDAGLAERLPGVTLDGEETERYSLPLRPQRAGESRRAEIWVGADDHLVRRILLIYDLRKSFLSVRGRIDVRLRDHGAPIEVGPPSGARARDAILLPPELRAALEQLDTVLSDGLPGSGPRG